MTNDQPSFLGVAHVRRAVQRAIEAAVGPSSFAPRGGTRQRPTWRSTVAPGWELVLEVHSDHGIAKVTIALVQPATDPDGHEFASRSWSPSIPWRIAREIGRASDATRHLRIFWGRPYWALEADHGSIHLAEADQVDVYVRLALPALLEQVNGKLARFARRPRHTTRTEA